MKIIVCTGDSHTWGQGASGLLASFNPPVQGGELRPVPFGFNCYVNLLRNEINRMSGSTATEEQPDVDLGQYNTGKKCELAKLTLAVDGTYKIAYVKNGKSLSPLINATQEDGKLVISAVKPCKLYRAEYYNGAYAVINAGVGSTTSQRYLSEYYNDYVKVLEPYMIIAEAHSINDWINRIPLDSVCINLISILNGVMARKVLLTVSPVLGTTTEPFNSIDYTEYIKASYNAAEMAAVTVADGNAQPFDSHFDDNWHPDDAGHKLYCDEILRVLAKMKLPGIHK